MDAAQLRERAQHFRSLAERADEQISGELLYLAEQYEALARELEQRGQGGKWQLPAQAGVAVSGEREPGRSHSTPAR